MHKPISIDNISLTFQNKCCFEEFTTQVYSGDRIAIIGQNGTGKSSMLNILCSKITPSTGQIYIPKDLSIAYVEQTIHDLDDLSGGQRFNKKLSEALALSPDLLMLDEPTNHLDKDNRKSLMLMLNRYQGTLIIVSHDTELLRNCIDTLWHINNNKIRLFNGSYDHYIHDIKQKRLSVENKITLLKREKKNTHAALMKEQHRAAKSKAKGEKSIDQKKWPTVVSKFKANRANQTSGNKKAAIDRKKQELNQELADLKLPEIITPKFSLEAKDTFYGNILSIGNGIIGYNKDKIILKNISLSLNGKERIAICGKNASGKSTLLKAILGHNEVYRSGDWYLPSIERIGYLDQHYSNLDPKLSIYDHIQKLRTDWEETEIRKHLNDFLFRKNEEVSQLTYNLSGGEKARASLSLIAAKTPPLLILDEITNNIDLETKEHITQVLKEFPGALIIVCHEDDFLKSINIDHTYTISNGNFSI